MIVTLLLALVYGLVETVCGLFPSQFGAFDYSTYTGSVQTIADGIAYGRAYLPVHLLLSGALAMLAFELGVTGLQIGLWLFRLVKP